MCEGQSLLEPNSPHILTIAHSHFTPPTTQVCVRQFLGNTRWHITAITAHEKLPVQLGHIRHRGCPMCPDLDWVFDWILISPYKVISSSPFSKWGCWGSGAFKSQSHTAGKWQPWHVGPEPTLVATKVTMLHCLPYAHIWSPAALAFPPLDFPSAWDSVASSTPCFSFLTCKAGGLLLLHAPRVCHKYWVC